MSELIIPTGYIIEDLRSQAMAGSTATQLFHYLVENAPFCKTAEDKPNFMPIMRFMRAAFDISIPIAMNFALLECFPAGHLSEQEVDAKVTPYLLVNRDRWV